MTFPSVWVAPGNRVVVAYGSGDVTGKLQFMAINAFPLAKLDDANIYWHWHTELTLPDDESVLKLFEIQDSTLALRDEVKYGITYNKTAENQSDDSILYVLKREAYERFQYTFDRPEFSKMGKISWEEWEDVPYIEGGNVWREVDLKRYELKDHLGNVRVIVSDLRHCKLMAGVPTDFTALIKHYSNYYPFGMEKPAMVWDKGGYRYGFNTQENTDEISGIGNHTTAEFWEYDTRLGRRWNLDPKPQISISDYAVNTDNPILYNDPNGDCPTCLIGAAIGAGVGLTVGLIQKKSAKEVFAMALGGAVGGAIAGSGAGLILAYGSVIGGAGSVYVGLGTSIAGAISGNLVQQGLKLSMDEQDKFDEKDFSLDLVLSVPSYFIDDAIGKSITKAGVGEFTEKMTKHELDGVSRAVYRRGVKEAVKKIQAEAKSNGIRVSSERAKSIAEDAIKTGIVNKSSQVPVSIWGAEQGASSPFNVGKTLGVDYVKDQIKKRK